jgi:plastocyanin
MRSLVGALLLAIASLAWAEDPTFEITIKDHRFTPSEVSVPSGTKIKLVVKNEDATAEEFESKKLNREKVIAGKSRATIFVGPLKPGEYPFVGEYHEKTAIGKIIAK